jgi:hypothetical protein
LLNAFTGIGATLLFLIFSSVICLPYFKNYNNFSTIHILVLIVFWFSMIIITYFTYQGWPSLLPCIATFIGTYALMQHKAKIYRILQLPQGLLYLIYFFVIKSYFGVIEEVIIITVLFFSIIKSNKEQVN